jgi:hypothetical protein
MNQINDEILELIYHFGRIFYYRTATIYHEYKSFSVLVGFILFYFIKNRYSDLFSNSEYNEYFTSLFITLLITFFILIKCLITP